jgi:ferric-dicitrate binding protein FerR (iron transport regulator)
LSQSNFDRLLQKYLAGECTEEEEKIVLEWYETLINSSDLHLSETERSRIEAKLWNAITANVQAKEQTQAVKAIPVTSRTWFQVAAAACLLAVAGAGVIWYLSNRHTNKQAVIAQVKESEYDSLVNTTRAEKKWMLADSSIINLQPGAVIYYPRTFDGNTRDVYLHGSAFFKVYHNPLKHFKVHMNSGLTTEVLGTTFNIVQNKPAGNIEVAVVTGKVLVYRKQTQQHDTETDSTAGIILTRNKKVIYNATSSRFTTGIVDNPQPLSKTKTAGGAANASAEQPDFEDAPLQQVLQALSNIYGINMVTENEQIARYHFTGNLSGYNMYTQLDAICKVTQTTYEINGTQIIIKENQNR